MKHPELLIFSGRKQTKSEGKKRQFRSLSQIIKDRNKRCGKWCDMIAKLVLVFVVILVSGFVATLISGFYRQDFSIPGRTDIGYGFPLSWRGESGPVVYPEVPASSWLSWASLALNTAFWSLVIAVPIAALSRLFKTGKSKRVEFH
jgi:hypothetical protein